MNYLLPKEELLIQLQTADFVMKTQQQIAKDFALSGIYFSEDFLSTEQSYTTILSEIQLNLAEILKKTERELLQLMYQIDLPQSLFIDALGREDIIEQLSELILRREAYKVFLRGKFSG